MRLLLIGSFRPELNAAIKIAKDKGARVTHTHKVEEAIAHLCSGKSAELILVDVAEPIETLIASLKRERISIPVAAYGFETNTKKAVAAIKAGAKEYLPLPPDPEMLAAIFEAIAVESNTLIFDAPNMRSLMDMVDKIAPSDASVLITGESGTGKEMVARHIHLKSKRADAPFISVNCAAIPEQLLESELFGHEKGAFTGATFQRIGKFEEANNGTLLLDEISEMDQRLQAKLLRALQEREIDRVGGSKPVKLNLRILATSNRDLRQAVAEGKFREDLLFRLNVIQLAIPPLRERTSEIKLFAEAFIRKYAVANGFAKSGESVQLSISALDKLQSYRWPGNVRELENTMHRAVLLSGGLKVDESVIILEAGKPLEERSVVISSELNAEPSSEEPIIDLRKRLVGKTVESVERDLILGTLDHCLGNRTHAANILGISIRTLRNKLKAYGDHSTITDNAADG